MRPQHQTKYVVRAAIETSIRELNQAVEDMPFPRTPEDHKVREGIVEAVSRMKAALTAELPLVSS